MIIGVPKEIKSGEYRVSLTPEGATRLVAAGHQVLVQTGAGTAAGMADKDYRAAGASILEDIATTYARAEMVLKVKEILPPEYDLLREDHTLFTYIHSANNPKQTQALLDAKLVAIAYEDVMTDNGDYPLLAPMSEIAGEVGMLMGVYHSFTTAGGSGRLIGGMPGVEPAKVVILGAGYVGTAAAKCALGLGADVTIIDIDVDRLRQIRNEIFPNVKTLYSSPENVARILPEVDILVNGVKRTPGLVIVSRDMLGLMKRDSLIVDIDCEPHGAIETCDYTTHEKPIFEVDGIRHCCIPNLPAAAAQTASVALTNVTLPYVLELAEKGWLEAVKSNRALRRGLGFAQGHLTFKPTAIAQNRPHTPAEEAIKLFDHSP